MTATAYIGLGSNLGDRRDYLNRAVQALQELPGIEVIRVSSYYETEPVGGPPGQGNYLNAAAEMRTELDPEELLRVLLRVEQMLGRVRSEWHGPRTLDLDLLLYDDVMHDEPHLIIPHSRMHERFFVLEPLAEIAPRAVHPGFECTVADLLWKLRVSTADKGEHSAPEAGAPLPAPDTRLPARELAGKRALVTGSTSGIGRAIALELASAGADVIVHGRRREAADSVVEQVRALGVQAQSAFVDLIEENGLAKLIEQAWAVWDGLDIWINNAGVDTLTGAATSWPFERKLEELLAVDVKATVVLSREIGQRMRAQGSGALINMGWDQAETGMEGDSGQLFAISKGAVMAFTRSLALSLAPEVRVNCLAPGWIRTAWGESASQGWQERVRRETPLGRWGLPEDVAAAARWLASPAAAFVTGQIIRVNGGAVR
ncbi:MAG TPA: 2-amino-4-hydroxy-6-hydroxymethyldihydropteridine diphosphokinase [Gemmataceae bacterium]|nr:2-amino-4-hydroxy-6-hydroxymethyldihydropteridine diphosphokinase [Gemmataceae bacterium]